MTSLSDVKSATDRWMMDLFKGRMEGSRQQARANNPCFKPLPLSLWRLSAAVAEEQVARGWIGQDGLRLRNEPYYTILSVVAMPSTDGKTQEADKEAGRGSRGPEADG